MKKRHTVWAFGGGVQTICILTLIAEGQLEKPDLAVMSNTGREASAVWRYIDQYAKPIMDGLGLEFHIAPHSLATVDLYSHKGELLIPAFTSSGKFHTYCSSEWKKYVNRRYLRSLGYGPNKPIVMWFGMSFDEIDRLRVSDKQWITNHYPLVFDVPKRRHECLLQIEGFGLPRPPKSACKMCPNRTDEEWREMQVSDPDDWQEAVELDREIRARDKYQAIYLHEQRVPLDQVELHPERPRLPLLDECADVCWT